MESFGLNLNSFFKKGFNEQSFSVIIISLCFLLCIEVGSVLFY